MDCVRFWIGTDFGIYNFLNKFHLQMIQRRQLTNLRRHTLQLVFTQRPKGMISKPTIKQFQTTIMSNNRFIFILYTQWNKSLHNRLFVWKWKRFLSIFLNKLHLQWSQRHQLSNLWWHTLQVVVGQTPKLIFKPNIKQFKQNNTWATINSNQ